MTDYNPYNKYYLLTNAIDMHATRCIDYILSLKPSAMSFPAPTFAGNCHCPIKQIIRENDSETLEKMATLPDFKEKITMSIEDGTTYLHMTVQKKRSRLTEILLQNGVDANVKDRLRNTPLHDAVDVENAKLLVKAGANVTAKNGYDFTPLQYAYQTGKTGVYHYLSKVADAEEKQGGTPENRCKRCARNLPKQVGKSVKKNALRDNNPKLWSRQFMPC
jgi:ankyrin repeat protein